jgi:hypothetical protein
MSSQEHQKEKHLPLSISLFTQKKRRPFHKTPKQVNKEEPKEVQLTLSLVRCGGTKETGKKNYGNDVNTYRNFKLSWLQERPQKPTPPLLKRKNTLTPLKTNL